jgi:uncharacterized protein YyaL (SSP411 family)
MLHTNHLVHETSPYLLQHAHNPVEWYPWGEEAFQRAKQEKKPILLSIGYSACHWCHVMEQESFENEEIAALMNEHFVNIKVDREERPDLDEVYMTAVQMLTGRGGWPMTVFLTPEGKPFFGGTYFPPEDRHGVPGFPKVLKAGAQAYRERPQDVERSVRQILEALDRLGKLAESARPFAREVTDHAAEQLSRSYDPELGGGFHRYTVDEKWLVPHFEKMLYDNAQLIRIYVDVFRITKDPFFKRITEETLDYLLREMFHPQGGFYSTQDADSEGVEGIYFVWSRNEVMGVLGEEVGEIFCRIYDVSDLGNFEGHNILHPILTPEQSAKYFKRSADEIASIISQAKAKLLKEREKRVKPFRDDKILTSWNGLMLSGLADAYEITGAPRYREVAAQTVEFIFTEMFREGTLLHTYRNGQAKLRCFLDDYAFLIAGLLDLYEATLERALLERAVQLTEVMILEFWDDIDGAFFYTGKSHEELISRSKPAFDGSIPSGNSVATQVLLRLFHYSGKEDYLRRAEKVLRLYYDALEKQPFGSTSMIEALDYYLEKPKEIVLMGDPENQATQEMLRKVHSIYLPNKTLQVVKPGEPLGKTSPLLEGKSQIDGKPTAYVCQNFTCSPPVTEWDDLKGLLGP